MRIWSIHPQYLDSKGIVALWRETLLAKHVLLGFTKGYKNHPQLIRFKNSDNSIKNIDFYLSEIYKEATKRSYHFDETKFEKVSFTTPIKVSKAQIDYEFRHLLAKIKIRDPQKYQEIKIIREVLPHPLFSIIDGYVEDWEIRK